MQRIASDQLYNEEWTKYFVNGFECKREDIYQTVVDKGFYCGEVNIERKYHHEQVKTNMPEIFRQFMTVSPMMGTSNQTENYSANFSLDLKKFTEHCKPESNEFKMMIDKMLSCVDMFFNAEKNYKEYSGNLKICVRQCMMYLYQHYYDLKNTYNNIFSELMAELFVNVFDRLSYYISHLNTIIEQRVNNIKLPPVDFFPANKEIFNQDWDDSKKSKYINKYLQKIVKKLDSIEHSWLTHVALRDKSTRAEIKEYFATFRASLNVIEGKLKSEDSLHQRPGLIYRFLHRGNAENNNNESAIMKPKK